jgi:hypothetical protein
MRPEDYHGFAREHLPRGFREHGQGMAKAFEYDVVSQYGDRFVLLLAYDQTIRQFFVRLLDPQLERLDLIHGTHLYSDGRLCLTPNSGYIPVVNGAIGRSVMWCNGISAMVRGHAWPWGEY